MEAAGPAVPTSSTWPPTLAWWGGHRMLLSYRVLAVALQLNPCPLPRRRRWTCVCG